MVCSMCKIGGRSRKRKNKRLSRKKRYSGGKWTKKYKQSINCKNPKGFSQKQYCKRRKTQKGGLAMHSVDKNWVCRGNIGCARNVNIYA